MIIVTPRKNGAKGWRAAWKQPMPDGTVRQMYRHIGDVSRAEAMMRCGEIQRELDAAPLIEPDSIESWSLRFFAMCGKLTRETRQLYELTFSRLVAHLGAGKRLDEVTDADARSFVAYLESLRKADGVAHSSSSINRHLRDAHRIWAIAIEARLTTTNPFASRAAKEGRQKHRVGVAFSRYVPLSELALLLKACPNESWRLIFNLARLGGLRRNEIERADWSQIDLQARRMTVEGGEDDGATRDSTKRHRRVVPIKPELYEVLANQPSRTGLLVRVNPNNFERDARGVVDRSGVEDYGKPLHSLRASFANDMMDQHPIQDVAEWLGHSVEVAMRHYRQRERGSRIEQAVMVPLARKERTDDHSNTATVAVS
jgi:integrase